MSISTNFGVDMTIDEASFETMIPLSREKSYAVYTRACRFTPGGVNSPVRAFPGLKQTPMVVHSGARDQITDVDGYTYIDFCGSWGALIHGHAHPAIVEAVQSRVAKGSTFGITTEEEARLAELVVGLTPVEKVRFTSSGTEATMSAIRLARGFTGRSLVLKFEGHYHGHADSFLVKAGSGVASLGASSSSAGVLQEAVKHTICLPFNDPKSCRQLFDQFGSQLAAVIVEPIAANMGLIEPNQGFLQMLREETAKCGALLIFDEVITGFRVALGGAAHYYGIEPDLCCYGKILGGGFPAAAFGGRAEIMSHLAPEGNVYQGGTLSGNPVAMEAGYQALLLCQRKDFYKELEEKTNILTLPIKELIEKKSLDLTLHQVGSMFTLFFGQRRIERFEDVKGCHLDRFAQFFQTLFQRGIYLSPSQFEVNFVSAAHSIDHLLYTRDCILEALSAL